MKALKVINISEHGHLTRCESGFQRAICSLTYRYCIILIYYYLMHVY